MNAKMEEGLIILIVGMGMVFLALVTLHLVFEKIVPGILSIGVKRKQLSKEMPAVKVVNTADEITAIAAAIYMFMEETHDEENAILTIAKSSKNYSPWSSKIYVTHHLHSRLN